MDSLQLRLAASCTVTRPDFGDLNPNLVLGAPLLGALAPTVPRSSQTGGNPFLQPFESWNYDASVEYFFSRSGFAALTVFRRDLDGFFQPSSIRVTDPTSGVIQINTDLNC